MIYYLDGYNLIFHLMDTEKTLFSQRQILINYLQKKFASLQLSGLLVFDGRHRRDEESGLSYKSPLDIAYAPKGQTADAYIIEKIEHAKNPKEITVVTNDQGLTRHARSLGSKVQTNSAFIQFLKKKSTKPKAEKIVKDTPRNIDRLLKIFEQRIDEL